VLLLEFLCFHDEIAEDRPRFRPIYYMNALIFGAAGQDGYYLSRLLQSRNLHVLEASRSGKIKRHKPQYVFHLAASSTTHHDALFDNHAAISTGTLNILECVRLYSISSKVFLSGSAMQFRNDSQPIDEQTPFDASSPYSLARIHSVYAGRYYRNAFGLKVYVGYFFNHDSPLRTERHVNQKIASAVKRIASGSNEKLEIGSIDVQKEFNFAGDVVEAVWTLVSQDSIYEAVIGSGVTHSIREWAEYCFEKINKNWRDYVVPMQKFAPEYSILKSNPILIRSMGWKPKVGFHQLADMMMEP
jgi:GDPmannose 4,6-dehydratase